MQKTNTPYRLALDLGTTSIGWMMYELDNDKEPSAIMRAGVRIFDDGRDAKSLSSLKSDRREARSMRRRRDRFLQRQRVLMNALIREGLMPNNETERKELEHLDPYDIRKRALGEKVSPFEMGRALFHINQRRGFKSNRKSADNEAGRVKLSIAKLENDMSLAGAKTLGEYLADRHEDRQTVRAREIDGDDDKRYELYPQRDMLIKEVDILWQEQAKYDPTFYTNEKKEAIKTIIFHQRCLKAPEVGKCRYFPDEPRASKALPTFQHYRMMQDLHNLHWINNKQGINHPIKEIDGFAEYLMTQLEGKKELTFKAIKAALKKRGVVDYDAELNLETTNRKGIAGNLTTVSMRKAEAESNTTIWNDLDEQAQDGLILLLQDHKHEDEEVALILAETYGYDGNAIEKLLNIRLPDGHASLSQKAIEQMLVHMRDGMTEYEARVAAGFADDRPSTETEMLSPKLDYYGKALQGHVIGGSFDPKDNTEKFYGAIPNPTVHIALNQIRQVVNELIRLHGKPTQIALEVARDLPRGADGKRDLEKQQNDGIKRNERAREVLAEFGMKDSRANRQKFLLWEQLAAEPENRRCPFTGKIISKAALYSDLVEVEHILPFSRTLDDSMANKTLSMRQANRQKGNRTPYEAFGDSDEWPNILDRSQKLPFSKRWRFKADAMERFEKENGFLNRQLQDTRYISRYTSQYLTTIIPERNIWVVTGRLTAILRGFWGLNHILNEDGNRKNRDDHRHHAVDAAVIGMTSRSMVQRLSNAAARSETLDAKRLFGDSIEPWDGFRADVERHIKDITVSHRPRKKNQGQLHKETAYGIVKYDPSVTSIVVHRVKADYFTKTKRIEKIRDNYLKRSLLQATLGLSGKDFGSAVKQWFRERGMRGIRIIENKSVTPISDKYGNSYKGYETRGNAYITIFENPKNGKWASEIVSRFEINQRGFIPKWQQDYPDATFIMELRQNDMILLSEKEQDVYYRVQKISGTTITLAPPNEANVDKRNTAKEDEFAFTYKTAASLQKAHAVKIYISPTGLIHRRDH